MDRRHPGGWSALLHGATFLCLKTTDDMRERSRQAARRVAPLTAPFVIGFIIWTHVTAGTAFFLNLIELLAILAVLAAVWLVCDHREGFAFPRPPSRSRPASWRSSSTCTRT